MCNPKIKMVISNEIMKQIKNDKDNDFVVEVQYKPTTILNVFEHNHIMNLYSNDREIYGNMQKIIITTENPFVLQCKDEYDLWFAKETDGKIHIYSFTDFKGYKEVWNKDVYYLYKKVLSGIYGDFIIHL
jgi:hypothetical protein